MKYMVMECQYSYAIVLDEDGNFLTVANRNYQIGQMVTDVVPMHATPRTTTGTKRRGWIYSLTAVAACLALIVSMMFSMGQTAYASVFMTINPQVRIDVNRHDVVVGVEGTNTDGAAMVAEYNYRHKHLDLVMDELLDLAANMGYLSDGTEITITLKAEDTTWVATHESSLSQHVTAHLNDRFTPIVHMDDDDDPDNEWHGWDDDMDDPDDIYDDDHDEPDDDYDDEQDDDDDDGDDDDDEDVEDEDD